MDVFLYLVFFSTFGSRCAWTLYCYNCLSLDSEDADCVELKGRGMNNVDKYYLKCGGDKNACSLYLGHFEDVKGKPSLVVWRRCDYKWPSEVECRSDEGPGKSRNTGRTCKCTGDFCNWREGVDNPQEEAPEPAATSTPTTTLVPLHASSTASATLLAFYVVLSSAIVNILISELTFIHTHF